MNVSILKKKNVKDLDSLQIILFYFLIWIMLMLGTVSAHAQQTRITLSAKDKPIHQILKDVEAKSGYSILVRKSDYDTNTKISVAIVNKDIEETLKEIFKDPVLKIDSFNKNITVMRKPQEGKKASRVTGMVTDSEGVPIIGATVKEKNSDTNGTITNMDGVFTITASVGSELEVTFIGYVAKQVFVPKGELLNITLVEDNKVLNEVVVTAYSTGQKKASMVGSVQQIKPSELKVPTSNLSNSFAGRLSGVIAVSRSGEPGADGSNFWIRGTSTFSGATDALIILDGVEVTKQQLNSLDPEVIDGFSILKDATATALYGTRGANGVMIVTTKTGADLARPIINFRIEGAMSQLSKVPQFVDGATYMDLYNEAKIRDNPEGFYNSEQMGYTRNHTNPYAFPDIDWYDEMFKKNSYSERVNFNIRGGSKRVDYFMSASLKHSDGNLKSLSKDYYSFNNNISVYNYDFINNLNIQATSTTKVSLGLTLQVQDWSGPNKATKDIFASVMNANPIDFPITWPKETGDSYVKWGGKGGSGNGSYLNPVGDYVRGYSSVFNSNIVANFKVEQKLDMITKGLKLSGLFSYKNYLTNTIKRIGEINQFELDKYDAAENSYSYKIVNSEKATGLTTESESIGNRNIYLQAMIDYSRTFGLHDVNAMLLYNQDQFNNNKPIDLFNSLPKRRQGIAGRLSYAFDGKYLAEANFGYNGSENFPKGKRFGFFPSLAVGYNISAEKFWKPLSPYISHLKLRASWGLVGNDQTGAGRFSYLEDLAFGSDKVAFTTGTGMNYKAAGPLWNRVYNGDMTWEVGEKLNIGVDFQIINDILLSVDVFKETRRDIFMERNTVSQSLGFGVTKIAGNFGKMENKGLDASLDYNKQVTKDLFVSLKGTFTYAKNKILERDEPFFQLYPNLSSVGYSANQLSMYLADGLFATDEEAKAYYQQSFGTAPQAGDIRYKNLPNACGEADTRIDANDKMYAGHPTVPEIVYGFGPSLRYKNLDFSFFFQGVGRTSLMISGIDPFDTPLYRRGVVDFIAQDHWCPDNPNPNAAYPRLIDYQSGDNATNNSVWSTYWLRDASFLKLKNMEIGYTFKNMRMYVSGMNLLTYSKFKLWDPEMGGGSGMQYPTQRTFSIGFQMTIK